MEEKESQRAYFKLMEVVGPSGKYQNIVLAIFCVVVYSVGSLSLGGPYYFAVAPYANCPEPYSTASQCSNYVCSLPIDQRSQYLQPQMAQLSTLGNQFGDYHCQNADIIATAMGMFFLGSIFGYICTGPLVDNFGRKITFNACLLLGLTGNLFVASAVNLPLAEIGLFLMGFGLQNSFNLCFYFLSEQFENKKRQLGGVIIQSCFCVGGLATILWFFLLKQWRTIFWAFYFLPLAAVTLLALRYLKETPRFLIKRLKATQIRSQLRFIARLNGREAIFEQSQYTSESALQQMKEDELALCEASEKKYFTFVDLFRYVSLRSMSVHLGLVAFSVGFLYYAPVMLIDSFGFDFYLNGVLLNISQFVTYAVSFFFIGKLKRRKLAIWMFTVGLACSIVLFFLHSDAICLQNCWNAKTVFEFITVLILRFAVALEFQVFLIYLNELYPTQVAGMGFSYVSVVGTLPNVFIPELITLCNRHGINIMIFFCLISLLGIFSSSRLKQTQGMPPCEKIKQFGTRPAAAEIQLVQQAMGS